MVESNVFWGPRKFFRSPKKTIVNRNILGTFLIVSWKCMLCVLIINVSSYNYFIEDPLRKRLFKYTENFTTKNWKFSDKKFWYFSYFCSKHRLCVLVRTDSYYIKVGFKGVKIKTCLRDEKKTSLSYPHLPRDLVLGLTLNGSNYPGLEQISMVPKIFELLKFDWSLFAKSVDDKLEIVFLFFTESKTWYHWTVFIFTFLGITEPVVVTLKTEC